MTPSTFCSSARPSRSARWLAASALSLLALAIVSGCRSTPAPPPPKVSVQSSPNTDSSLPDAIRAKGFIYEQAPFPSTHASTLVETPHGIAAAWFGGTDEGEDDVNIWFSRYTGFAWTTPALVAEGLIPESDRRYPCWNPVLYQVPLGPLVLFYKVGPNPREWWGMRMESQTGGRTWSAPERLPEGILGPVRNKPVLLGDGTLLCGSSTEDRGWRLHMEQSPDSGHHWSRTPPLNDPEDCGLIQPTILAWPNRQIQILCRSQQGFVYQSWMQGSFEVWSKPAPTGLPNPNSGIDGVVLADGRGLLVYNHTRQGRSPLNVAVSRDGRTWTASVALEDQPGEYSYPAVIQADNGLVHVTYTWKREKIRHVVLDPERL